MANDKRTLSFLGSGNMAAAIGRGLADRQAAFELCFYDRSYDKAAALADMNRGARAARTLAEAAEAELLLLAVKPQSMAGLLDELAPLLRPGRLLLTIAAGLPLAFYERRLPGTAVVRVMPNTSAAALAAVSGLMAGRLATAEHKALAEEIFAAVGSCVWIKEEEVHALTALSGSGPAYFYYFTEALAKAGEALGLAPDVARALARQTSVGAGKMLELRPEPPQTLREQVTSKGGTTAAALSVFAEEDALTRLVGEACRACAKRSLELAAETD